MNGSNDNPISTQFQSAYRKLLHQSDIRLSESSNVSVQSSSNVLTISSFSKHSNLSEDEFSLPRGTEQEEEEWNEVFELESLENCNHILDKSDSGITFIAHLLERRLLTGSIYCNFCKDVLQKNAKVNDNLCINFETGKPCASTFHLCKLTDIAIKSYINTGPHFKKKIYLYVMNQIDFEKIFPEFFLPQHDVDHKHYLIKYFIDEYINKKCAYLAKQKTISLQKRYVRNSLRKLGHNLH